MLHKRLEINSDCEITRKDVLQSEIMNAPRIFPPLCTHTGEGRGARLMAYKHVRASFAGICRDTDSLQRKTKIKRYSRNYRCPEKGARRRTSAHTSCEISRNIELQAR